MSWSSLPHPDSPVGGNISYAEFHQVKILERAECVREAAELAQTLAGAYIARETGRGLKDFFVSGWKVSPDQIKALTTTGRLGGG